MQICHLKSDLISPTPQSQGLRNMHIHTYTRPEFFTTSKPQDGKEWQANFKPRPWGKYPPRSYADPRDCSTTCKHLAGKQGRATHWALGRRALLLGRPPLQGQGQDSAQQQQRWQQEKEGCAGPRGRHGGVACGGQKGG